MNGQLEILKGHLPLYDTKQIDALFDHLMELKQRCDIKTRRFAIQMIRSSKLQFYFIEVFNKQEILTA